MTEDLARILARVASGEPSPEAAEPLVVVATVEPDAGSRADQGPSSAGSSGVLTSTATGPSRAVRIRVTDGGRQVVNLRIPMSLASLAGTVIPGLADPQIARVQQALRDGEVGTILDVRDEDGSGVVIATE